MARRAEEARWCIPLGSTRGFELARGLGCAHRRDAAEHREHRPWATLPGLPQVRGCTGP